MADLKFCPQCGSVLSTKFEGGRERVACLKDGCGYFHFGDSSIGAGGVVVQDGKALLIQRGINPGKGMWQIPGGYVEVDEPIHTAVEREVLEEAGVVAQVTDALGFRHAASVTEGRPANLYVVFRLEAVSGEPRFDGHETTGAGYFSLDEMDRMDGVQALSLWAIRMAFANPPGSGLLAGQGDIEVRPGWSLFGLSQPTP
jgi:ADP-ribose pyrophosphatase YjhB (NUDIX family)